MTETDIGKINTAVQDCLRQCNASPEPLAALAAYLVKLSSNPDWKEEQVEAVEAGVIRMLAVLASPSDSGIIPAGLLPPAGQRS